MVVIPSRQEVSTGSDASFSCSVEPLVLLETVSISWSLSDQFLTSMRTLKLKKVQASDAGDYRCTGQLNGITSQAIGKLHVFECSLNEFTCLDGSCIEDYRRCDFVQDCPANDDEDNCREYFCLCNVTPDSLKVTFRETLM